MSDLKFEITDPFYASSIYLYDDIDIQFRDHKASVDPDVAYRMSRTGAYLIEKKRIPFNPDSWKKEKRMIWSCNVASANGFGYVAESTIKELIKMGVRVYNPGVISDNIAIGGEYVDPLVLQSFKARIMPDCLEVQHCQPPSIKSNITSRVWNYTMFETTHIPRSWIPFLNSVERIIVPSSWLVDSWHEQGITTPISVIGHGIDPAIYEYIERPEREDYTFLHYGQLATRKGTDLVFQAFNEEFANEPHAKLVLKHTYPMFPVPLGAERVEYITAAYSKEEMRELLGRCDCMVFPTRGEGFGLTAFEAMATGLPTIVTGWSGPADYADPKDTMILNYTMSRSIDFDNIYHEFLAPGEDTGYWAEPNLEQLKEYMRWCFEHRNEAKAMGKKASKRILTNWTWTQKIQGLVSLIDENI